jgi:hypothetical protein
MLGVHLCKAGEVVDLHIVLPLALFYELVVLRIALELVGHHMEQLTHILSYIYSIPLTTHTQIQLPSKQHPTGTEIHESPFILR